MDSNQMQDNVDNAATLNPEETAELMEEPKTVASETASKEKKTVPRDLEFLFDVPLEVKYAGDPLDLYVNSRLIARGEAVKVGDRFGIKLTEVISQSERISRLG